MRIINNDYIGTGIRYTITRLSRITLGIGRRRTTHCTFRLSKPKQNTHTTRLTLQTINNKSDDKAIITAKIVGHMADVPLHTSSRSHKPFDFKHSLPAGSNLHVAWLQHGARTSQSSPASTCVCQCVWRNVYE